MRRAVLALALWLAAAPTADAGVTDRLADWAARARASGTVERRIAVDGVPRSYRLHLPADRPEGPLALVLDFHGYGLTAAREEGLSGFSAVADREGFAVAYPQADGKGWRAFGNDGADLAYVRALLADVARAAPVDPERVYAAGISNGAQMTVAAACALPGRFAAVALVAGGYSAPCAPPRPSALIYHGTADRVLAYDGRPPERLPVRDFAAAWGAAPGCEPAAEPLAAEAGARRERWACPGALAELVTLEGHGHAWPEAAAAEIWRFFRARSE